VRITTRLSQSDAFAPDVKIVRSLLAFFETINMKYFVPATHDESIAPNKTRLAHDFARASLHITSTVGLKK
jgi:hypothetical protein